MIVRYYIALGPTVVDAGRTGPVNLSTGDSLRWARAHPDAPENPPVVSGQLSDPMTEEEYVAWQQTKRLVEYADFVEAVREQAFHPADEAEAARFPGGIVHCFIGALGADWSAESVIDVLSRAFFVEWDSRHLFGHQLHVRWNEASIGEPARHWEGHFDVKLPVVEDLDGAPLPPTCQKGGDVYEAVRAWVIGNFSEDALVEDIELRNLLIALAAHLRRDDDVGWEGVCNRAMAVALGAGAPPDATLPEAVEWLAGEIHGPSLRPGADSPLVLALEAIRLTQEYVQLPAREGWTWYDVYRRFRPDDAERLRQDWLRHDAYVRAARETKEQPRSDRRRRWGFGRSRG